MSSSENKLRLQLRLRIYKDDLLFGSGIAELMERVDKNGSMSAACREMGMAYSKGWKIVRRAENQLGYPLMDGKRGGTGGGKMVLTSQGRELLDRYREMETEINRLAVEVFNHYFPEERKNMPVSGQNAGKMQDESVN